MAKQRYTVGKHGGDDCYSWAVFDKGKPISTGMGQGEARSECDRLRKIERQVGDTTDKLRERIKQDDMRESVLSTWRNIMADIDWIIDNAGAIEMVLDANRMATYGDPSMDKLVHELCMEHGCDKIYGIFAEEYSLI